MVISVKSNLKLLSDIKSVLIQGNMFRVNDEEVFLYKYLNRN